MPQPSNYVENQRRVNMRHTNGAIDTPTEEAITYAAWLGEEVKDMGLGMDSILDVGCRTGYSLPVLRRNFTRVVGCDIVPEFIAIANTRGEAIEADMHNLPFKNGEFDWIFCTGTLEHAHDASKVVSEFYRVAKVGVFLTADTQTEAEFKANPSHYTRHSMQEWVEMLEQPPWRSTYLKVEPKFIEGIWRKLDA